MKKPQPPSLPSSPGGKALADRVVRKRMADGTIKEYRYPRRGAPETRKPRWAADSLNALLEAYRRSPEWDARSPKTRYNTLTYLRPLYDLGDYPAAQVSRRVILDIRDGIARGRGPEAANSFIKAAAGAFKWGRDREWFDHSPIDRIERLPGGAFAAWTEDQVSVALAGLPEPLRRVVVLGVHTSQRRSDLIALKWGQIAGSLIRLTQGKTGVELAIPIHPDLAAELEVWRREAAVKALPGKVKIDTVLTKASGHPWGGQDLTQAMRRALLNLGIQGINVHGLRKLAATRLAEAGCSAHEIAAITGHQTLQQVAHYTKSADQKKLAAAAVQRLKLRADNS